MSTLPAEPDVLPDATQLHLLSSPGSQEVQIRKLLQPQHKAIIANRTSRSLFLELPPELRCIIIEFAVSESQLVVIDTGVLESGITMTSKEVRHEALPIFYSCNTFGYHNPDYNTFIYRKLSAKENMLRGCYGKPHSLNAKNLAHGKLPNWKNLLAWFEAYHKGEVDRSDAAPSIRERRVDL